MKPDHKMVMRAAMMVFYAVAGVLHIVSPAAFLRIIPAALPWPAAIVSLTGFCEMAGAAGLIIPYFRRASGIALAAYAVCVFPANVNHALLMIPIDGIPNSWWYHGPRLALQPLLVWWALYCAEVIDWPFRMR